MTRTVAIEMDERISAEIERAARERGVTVEDFIAAAAAEKAGAIEAAGHYFAQRAARADPGAARAFFTRRGVGEPPRSGDQVEE